MYGISEGCIGAGVIVGLYEVIDTCHIILYMIISGCIVDVAVGISKMIKNDALEIDIDV